MVEEVQAYSAACLAQVDSLDAYLEQLDGTPVHTQLRDELGRYRVWCSSTNACKTGAKSLEHQMRHSERSKNCMLRFLTEMQASIIQVNAILHGQGALLDELEISDSGSDSSLVDACDEPTELEQIVQDLAEIVTSLFDLTRSVSYESGRQLMIKASNIDMAHFKFGDRLEIQLHFPGASPSIIERLAEANNRRRQIFKYLQEQPLVNSCTGQASSENSDQIVVPSTEQQLATLELPGDATNAQDQFESDETLALPDLPSQGSKGSPFTCPYCHEALHVLDIRSWRLHVLEDLRPYVCTYERCEYPLELFSDEHQWMQHEKLHRRSWTCPHCHNYFHSSASLRDHLSSEHDHVADDTTFDLCESSMSLHDTMECPMCATPTSNFREHVAQHLRAVAFYTLPRPQDSALSSIAPESVNNFEVYELESETWDVAMLERWPDLMEAGESEMEQSISTLSDLTRPELEHELTDVEKVFAAKSDLPDAPPDLGAYFIKAAARGDLIYIKTVYEHKSDVFDFRDIVGQALLEASRTGHADVVSFLLQSNHADPNFSMDGSPPLAWAAMNGHSRVVQLLLNEPTVEIEAKDTNGATPLILAAAKGHHVVVKLLLDHKANIEARDTCYDSPLSLAAAGGHLDVVEALLEHGADVNGLGPNRAMPLLKAVFEGHESIVRVLLKAKGDFNCVGSMGETPLHQSAVLGHERATQILRARGVDPAELPLYYSMRERFENIVRMLLDAGADVNAIDRYGHTSLYLAARKGNTGTVRLLLRAQGGRIYFGVNDSESLFAHLEREGFTEILDLLEAARSGFVPEAAPSSQAAPQSGLRAGSADFINTKAAPSGEPKTKATGSKKAKQDSRLEDHQSED